MGPAVSVVLPVSDGADLLPRAVVSVLAQTFAEWELLVTDDGSADATPELLAQYAEADPRVRVFTHPASSGVSAARNTAIREARAEWVTYLDHDDEFYPGYLAAVNRLRGRGDVLVFAYDLIEERPGHPGFGAVRTYDPRAFYEELPHRNIVVPLGVAHRRELFARSGYFDEALSLEEDADLWRRFARVGAAFAFVSERSGRYHVRPDSLSRRTLPT